MRRASVGGFETSVSADSPLGLPAFLSIFFEYFASYFSLETPISLVTISEPLYLVERLYAACHCLGCSIVFAARELVSYPAQHVAYLVDYALEQALALLVMDKPIREMLR